jgi:fructokinase
MTSSPSSHNVVCFGEVLWDILPTVSLPGGAPMNVAYHLKMLGNNPALITRIGTDENGSKLKSILEESEVDTSFFQVDQIHPTGIVLAKLGHNHEVTYDIVQPVAWDFIDWDHSFPSLLAEAEYFVCGSLASRNNVSRDTLYALLDQAQTKIVDINLRPPHYHRENLEYLMIKADILKLNLAELELIADWYSALPDTESRIKLIQDRFKINTLVVTLGGDGAMALHNGKFYQHSGYRVKVADTIGSGDAFLAGFIHQLLQSSPIDTALEFAGSMGALVAGYSGACPKYEVSEIKKLMDSNGEN